MESTLRLFKALPIKTKELARGLNPAGMLGLTIEHGFLFAPEVMSNYTLKELRDITTVIRDELGLSSAQMNSSFHKSWKKVKEASIEQLTIEQLIHYFSTYGLENLGINSKGLVYIPNVQLTIPDVGIEKMSFIVIKGYTKEELKEKVLKMLYSGIALKEQTINDIVDVALFVGVTEKEIKLVKNKEVAVVLYDYMAMVPSDPVEFLRFVVYKSTEKTLLIKDKKTIDAIKGKKNIGAIGLFEKYERENGYEKLAEIFYRFKPIFLAFRNKTVMKSIINKIRRLARDHHEPMREDFLNSITAMMSRGEKIDKDRLDRALAKVNTFRKIRLAYALKFRTKDADSIMYRVRNGRGFATDFKFKDKKTAGKILDIVVASIVKDLEKNVKGKKIFIPEFVHYTLPATEKQFTGNLPTGSYVEVPKDMIFGVHWEDVGEDYGYHRIDLDLSLINPETGKIGWDMNYRSEGKTILFSGDMTSAPKPNGASELFYVKRQKLSSFIFLVNYYNFNKDVEVPFTIFAAKENIVKMRNNYMVDPNNIIAIAKSKIDQKQRMLGLLVSTTKVSRFYFVEADIGRSITSKTSPFVEHARKYLFEFYKDTISLNKMLEKAGAKFVEKPEGADIDLSMENLEKDSIINLLTP